ncbi:hypothetical protein AAIA72_05600 [Hahella sp. SMD15-11]|uniref:Flagellar hook-length control protein FliK n=1 Tax=Thermohahella caldifontis TaxID=3142973 RepID=A0AB39V085_9GAMM
MATNPVGAVPAQPLPLQTDRDRPGRADEPESGRQALQENVQARPNPPDVQVTLSSESRSLNVSASEQVPQASQAVSAGTDSRRPETVPARGPSASDTLGANIDIQA